MPVRAEVSILRSVKGILRLGRFILWVMVFLFFYSSFLILIQYGAQNYQAHMIDLAGKMVALAGGQLPPGLPGLSSLSKPAASTNAPRSSAAAPSESPAAGGFSPARSAPTSAPSTNAAAAPAPAAASTNAAPSVAPVPAPPAPAPAPAPAGTNAPAKP
ncbi:MAG: hypothetical protein JO317_04020 [Verrucomicrobiae bacterium]|nr:hypothetical protein [Verrucomicrobiae bacterium]